jgi:hypothetical protein
MSNVTLTKISSRQYPLVHEIAFDYTNVSETGVAVAAVALPPNSEVTGGALIVDTAWDTGTTAALDIGDSTTAARYGSAIDLKTAARTALTLTGYLNTGGLDVKIKPALVGTAATAGAARLLVEYIIKDRGNEAQIS